MFKIVASDLDGTLLNAQHTISPFTKDVLQRLHQQGEHFVFATGRHHVDVAYIREKVGIPAFMITSNGARVHDADDNLVFSKNVDPQIVPRLYQLAKQDKHLSVHIYRDNDWLVDRIVDGLEKYHKDSGFHFTLFDIDNPPVENIAKLFYISDSHDHLVQFEHKLRQEFGDSINIAFASTFSLEVMGAGVSKGAALAEVAKMKGFSLENCIAFGDNMNDVEMLSMVKKGCIMENALPRVKQTLPQLEVIGNHKEEAVAHYLAKHLL